MLSVRLCQVWVGQRLASAVKASDQVEPLPWLEPAPLRGRRQLLRDRVRWAVLHCTTLLWWKSVVELVLAVAVALPECRLA